MIVYNNCYFKKAKFNISIIALFFSCSRALGFMELYYLFLPEPVFHRNVHR